MKHPINIIAAVDVCGGFGKNGKIPWHLPEDMKRFKQITSGGICIMGRRTYQDLLDTKRTRMKDPNYPIDEILPSRESIVITKDNNLQVQGARISSSLGHAVDSINKPTTRSIFILGGENLFIQALSWAVRVHLTIVRGQHYDCDVFFPVHILNKKYRIVDGLQTDSAYFVTYIRN